MRWTLGGHSMWRGAFDGPTGEYRRFLFRGNPVLDDSGKVVKWYGINVDLEDRTRAQDALRPSEETFRQIVDSIPGLVCTKNAAGEVLIVNRPILDYTGKAHDELKDGQSLVHPDDRECAIFAWLHSVETGEAFKGEFRVQGADGTYQWFAAMGLPLRDETGRILRWHTLYTDIDDRKHAEADRVLAQGRHSEGDHEGDRMASSQCPRLPQRHPWKEDGNSG